MAMDCFKYQLYLYGSEDITYLNAILQSQDYESSDCPPPPPYTGSPPPPHSVWQHNLHPFGRELMYD
jgi:hypothetical protein